MAAVFRAVPLVCGALGPDRDSRLERMCEAGTPMVRRAGRGWALASSSPDVVARRDGLHTWGRYVVEDRKPRSWEDAAHELGLAGLAVEPEGPLVHTDVFGVQDLFWRELRGTVYFSNRIHPLRGLDDAPLAVDLDAWGETLAFGGFVGAATGFAEIRRLEFGEVLRFDGRRVRRDRVLPSWLLDDASAAPDLDAVVAVLRDAVPALLPRTRTALPLSGGWDSRLIGMLMAANQARRPDSWTIAPDTGFDDDVELARAVADGLRLRHRVVHTSDEAWVDHREETLARVEHQTWLHTWLAPLAAEVRATRVPVLDGLGGDVLLRNLFSGPQVRRATGSVAISEQLAVIGGARLRAADAIAPELADRWQATALQTMELAGDAWSGHRSESVLRVLTLRTNRVIATAPMRLFAPDLPVVLPFMTPSSVRAALAVPVEDKDDHAYYRALLARLDPRVGGLRSTNDGPAALPSQAPRRQTSDAALGLMARSVLADAVVTDLLHPTLLRELESGELDAVRSRGLATLQWASAFADWRRTHAHWLGGAGAPARTRRAVRSSLMAPG